MAERALALRSESLEEDREGRLQRKGKATTNSGPSLYTHWYLP